MLTLVRPASWRVATVAFVFLAGASATSATPPSPAPVPVILDTDIGDDIDDTWALVMLLKSPNLDVRLITTDYGNTVYRAKIVARFLELASRTDIPIGIGIRESEAEGGQAEWVRDYDLARYPGVVHRDGVQALIDTVMDSKETITLIAIGPPPSLAAALAREPRIAGKLRLAGMYGSLRVGYGGAPEPSAEWNVRANVPATRSLLAAPWADAISTPLDTCGVVQLSGERYARVRRSEDPLLRALIENYRIWCPQNEWCSRDAGQVTNRSTTLFDTVAVYLAEDRDLVETKRLGVRVSDEGMTLVDESAPAIDWATEWKSLDEFEELLAERLTGPSGLH
ncbi:MAG: nucleoside hydrolase [Planctomycetota bacterium]|jgi:inosine-uridine nucleoside N-ribohydrolase